LVDRPTSLNFVSSETSGLVVYAGPFGAEPK
jgi:hypothetical protein